MARPKNAKPQETRQKILDAAVAELDEVGALGLSTRSVARRAGVGVATVHGHFVDRRGLLDAVIERVYQKITEGAIALREEIRGVNSPMELVEWAMRAGFHFGREHQNELRALQLQSIAEGGLDSQRQRNTQLPFLASLASVLAPQLDIPIEEVRLRMQSLQFLVARWSIASDDELTKLIGLDDVEECVRRVETYLVEQAKAQLSR